MTGWQRAALPVVLAASTCVNAEPLPAPNLSPFAALSGRPLLRTAATPRAAGWRLDSAIASHSSIGLDDGDTVYLDGETAWLSFSLQFPLRDGWELALSIPWFQHSSGILDRAIDRWHELTGLPDGERDRQPVNELLHLVSGPGDAFWLDASTSGIGDTRITLIRELPTAAQSLRLSVELATGDPDRLTGNGAVDIAVDWLAGGETVFRGKPLSWHSQAGILFPGRTSLPIDRQAAVLFAGGALDWQWHDRVGLLLQVNADQGHWDHPVDELGGPSLELTAGASWQRRSGSWYLAVSEDLLVDRSADVVFRFGWLSRRH